MQEQSGMIARLPAKGSIFNAIEWFWQYRLGHDLNAGFGFFVERSGNCRRVELAKVVLRNWVLRRFDYITDRAH